MARWLDGQMNRPTLPDRVSVVQTNMTQSQPAKSSLLIRDVHTIITMDPHDTVLRGGFIYVEDG